MNLVSKFFRNRAVKAYVLKLAPLLVKRYGLSEQYTVGQLSRTIQECKLNSRFIAYAIALYRHEESFNTINRYGINQALLNQLRNEIAGLLELPTYYTAKDIVSLSAPGCWKGGSHKNWQANRHGKTGL